jgi:pyrroloquinoline quinone biosynthesis protein D
VIDATSVPHFKRGMKFRYDTVREAWVVLGPERMFVPDEQAVSVLKLLDGERSVGDVVQTLAVTYDATVEDIFAGVVEMLSELEDKGVLQC